MPINFSTSSAIFRWQPACWLRITGADALIFLQGQFSSDLRALPAAGAVYGLWLSLKGRVLADSFVTSGSVAGEFWVGSYFSAAAVIRERLESHIIADDVTVEDVTREWAGITIMGAGVAHAGAGPTDGTVVFRGRRDGGESAECVYRIAAGEPVWARAWVGRQATAVDMLRFRIAARIPAVPVDVGPADLPNEAGLEKDAISYTKGCYLGQEVMARLKSMGQVRRRLLPVAGLGDVPATLPASLFAGGRLVGELRSAVAKTSGGWSGLAMLSLLHVTAGTKLGLAADGAAEIGVLDTP